MTALVERYGPIALTALLVFWIASKLVDLTWLVLDKPVYDTSVSPVATQVVAESSQGYDDVIATVAAASLFGKYVPPPVDAVENEPTEPVEEFVTTDYVLKGTVATTENDNGLAIVEYRGDDKVYLIGDSIASGIELKQVHAQHVILLRNGEQLRLSLPKAGADGGSSSSRSSNRRAAAQNRGRPTRREAAPVGNSRAVTAKLGDMMRPQPVFQDGKQVGYRVYPGRKREQFKALGLKAGDLITELNGTPLDDPSRGLEIFRSLGESSQVAVTIERNGAQTSLVLDTTELNLGK